jgi:hypothetical protein
MSKKDRPYNVLIIDDDENYVDALFREAQEVRLLLKHASSLEVAKEVFESAEGKSICGIILDVVCMKDREQEIPDPDFIMPAIEYFRSRALHIPIVILTGEPDRYKHLKEYFKGVRPIYSKGRDEQEMLSFLKNAAQELDREKVIRKYHDVFEIVERYLGYDAENKLIDCLNDTGKTEANAITGALGSLRKLQEYFYIALHKIDDKMLPRDLIFRANGSLDIRNERIMRHLKGNFDSSTKTCMSTEYIMFNSKEDRLLNYLYRGCSEELHVTEQATNKYTVQSLVFCFMDLVLWMKELAKKEGNKLGIM